MNICEVYSAVYSQTDFARTEYFRENLVIENVRLNATGRYICTASVEKTGEVAEASVDLSVECECLKKFSFIVI